MTEYFEIIKISDVKEREIEAYYINPDLSEFDKFLYVLKKGNLSQKISFAQNLEFYINTPESVKCFLDLLKEKMFDYEQELQIKLSQTLIRFFTEPYNDIIHLFSKEQIYSLLVVIIQIIIDDEKSKKNDIFIELFNIIVKYYHNDKLSIDSDFITFVVNLASFGKSNLSRMYSVIFTIGFINVIDTYNSELIDRFFRSATDLEKCVRVAIAGGFCDVVKYIGVNQQQIQKVLQMVR